jgi:hypothetical protein
MESMDLAQRLKFLRRTRILLAIFITGLVISGLTAFPLRIEIKWLRSITADFPNELGNWIRFIDQGRDSRYSRFPFLAYGTDWLAFAHIVIAIFFVPALKDPPHNLPLIRSVMLACILVMPTAILCGNIRGKPFFWQVLDCSFGSSD